MGSLGPDVARSVAQQMRFAFVDEEIIAMAAEQERLDPEVVADAEERRSFLSRVFESWGSSGAMDQLGAVGVAMVSESGQNPTERYRALIREAIQDTADRGQVVICAHAASITLAEREGILRALVTASPSVRARRVADEGALDPKEAERLIKREDAARADYLKRFYSVEQELPTHYDLVVSTDQLSAQQATGLIVAAAQAIE
jgi:cytidylate kinase